MQQLAQTGRLGIVVAGYDAYRWGQGLTVTGPNSNDRVAGHVQRLLNVQHQLYVVNKRLLYSQVC